MSCAGSSSLLRARLLLFVLMCINGALCRYNRSLWPDIESKWPEVKKNFTKREVMCPEGQHLEGSICCQKCPPGTKKTSGCTENGGPPICTSCTAGEDYMDHPHYYTNCFRCNLCDREHGLEVKENCTILQNVKCRCAKGFFCNTSDCKHCGPCTQCEHGILEECTENRDAICQVPEKKLKYLALLLFLIPPLVLAGFAVHRRLKRRQQNGITLNHYCQENSLLSYPDIDLKNHLSTFAENMELEQVKKLVRKMGTSEVTIDQVKHDCANATSEQKLQLLNRWYESHGKSGAYPKLMRELKNIGLRGVADRLQELVDSHPNN